jgi:hypothetical protein
VVDMVPPTHGAPAPLTFRQLLLRSLALRPR